ncbi:hypothetical protein ACHAXT_000763 [Thalassiosira profunda]
MATATAADEGGLRSRASTPSLVPSASESSISDYEERLGPHKNGTDARPAQLRRSSSLRDIAGSTAFQRRLSRQSSLSWGHKPSPLIGASCFLFLLPIPLMIRACCPVSAGLLGCVTVSSYLSDHVYTGLESWAHTFDRATAPLAFTSCLYSVYSHCGVWWAISSCAAVVCHVLANYYSKQGQYERFVIWHSLWHVVGVGLIVVCFALNGVVGQCWEGTGWEQFFP